MTSKRTNPLSEAKKRRLKHPCEFCQERFVTPQAKWGHYPSCPKRKPSLEPATKAEPEATFLNRESRRPGPDGQETKLLLLETQEKIAWFRNIADNNFIWAEFPFRAAQNHVEGRTTPEGWKNVYEFLGDVERDLDQMKGRLRLDRSLLFCIYHWMFGIQDAWL